MVLEQCKGTGPALPARIGPYTIQRWMLTRTALERQHTKSGAHVITETLSQALQDA